MLVNIIFTVQVCFLLYVTALFGGYVALFWGARNLSRQQAVLQNNWMEVSDAVDLWLPITVVLPAYNEEAVIVECVKTTLNLDYPALEVVVVCDGSKDGTFEVLVDAFGLTTCETELRADFQTKPVAKIMGSPEYPNLRVILKVNGGKADALNVGLNAAMTPLVCCCDADTLIEPHALRQLVRDFKEDSTVVATSGTLMLSNGTTFENGVPVDVRKPTNWLAAVQVLEYMRAFYWGRLSVAAISSMLIVSGAFGLFSRRALVDIGGYSTDTVGEDMDLIVRLHRHYRTKNKPYRITHAQAAVAWTEAPESLKMLRSQRMRWQRGLCEVMARHWEMVFEKNSGRPGKLGYSYFLFFECLAPVIELLGYIFVLILVAVGYHYTSVWLYMALLALSLSFLVTFSSVFVQQRYFPGITKPKEVIMLLAMAIPESLILKPITTVWRVKAMVAYLRGASAKWDPIARKGFQVKAN